MRKLFLYIILLAVGLPLRAADDFTVLDWQSMCIDSVLPVYTEVVPLESDYRRWDYVVQVLYPEWGPLTPAETEAAQRHDARIYEQLDIRSAVTVSRKVGMLDIAFVPLVRRGGEYRKLLSGKIVITPVAKKRAARMSARQPGERYTRESRLARGTWVKISVAEDGIYSLTADALRRMGFKDPAKVHLYGQGGHCLSEVSDPDNEVDDLQEVPLYKRQNDWLFWANGVTYWDGDTRVINPYSTAGYYFLTEEEGDNAAVAEPLYEWDESLSSPLATFTDYQLYERDEYAYYHGGRHLFEANDYASQSSRIYRLQTPNYAGEARLTVAFTAANPIVTSVTPTVNGQELTSLSIGGLGDYTYGVETVRSYSVDRYQTGETWNIRLATSQTKNAHLDYLALRYRRTLSINNDARFVAFRRSAGSGSGNVTFCIEGTAVAAMRIGEGKRPGSVLTGEMRDGKFHLPVADGADRFVAFSTTANYPAPAVAGRVENQNLHGLDSLDMVIIVPQSGKLTSEAQRLAEAHETVDGLRVAVIPADKIYNEFSSGTPDATAYRRLMKMLYDRAESDDEAPRYLLLFGDCAWDNRMLSSAWRNSRPEDYLLCFQSENSFSDVENFVMEDYFGLLDDGEGANLKMDKCDLGIGRFPVTSAAEAKVMVDKSIAHLTNRYAGNWKNILTFIGDDGDNNLHLRYADDLANLMIRNYPQMETRKVMTDAYERVSLPTHNAYPTVTELITRQVNDGALVINYTGHAAAYSFSHEFLLLLDDFAGFRGTNLPLWVAAACDVMPFDGRAENIGETTVLNPMGGGVAFYSTARTVWASENSYMNQWFMNYLLGTDESGRANRLGDAIRLAKTRLITDGSESSYHRQNKLHYALLGDPALTFASPTNTVVLDSINGQAATSEGLQLKAGQLVTLKGHVESAAADTLTGFNGIVTVRLYDNEETVTCRNNAGADKAFQFTNRDKVLFNGQDSLRAGHFRLQLVVPGDINYSNQGGRFVFYAVSDDRRVEANGYNENFTVGNSVENNDTKGPEIEMYLNREDFENGGVVNATPAFFAFLQDESGINYSGNGLGHDLTLIVDQDPKTTYSLNDSYQAEFGDYTRGSVLFSIPELSNGPHTLTLRAWDVLNNVSQQSLDFVVDGLLKPSILSIQASQNPAVNSTQFLIRHDRAGSAVDLKVEVFNFSGQCMWSHSETQTGNTGVSTVSWNLTNNAGGRLHAGVYLYRVTMSSGGSKEVSKTQKIIINGNK